MSTNNLNISAREMMAVQLYVYYPGRIPPPRLYSLAYPGAFAEVQALKDLPATASRWWRSRKIQDYLADVSAQAKAHQEAEASRIEREILARLPSHQVDSIPEKGVDYSDPRNQRKKLNELINGATDPHDQLDAIKVMIARQAEITTDKPNNPRVKVYLPITCDQCRIRHLLDVVRMDYPELFNELKSIVL